MDTIYVESDLTENPRVRRIIGRYPSARVVPIKRYTEVFNPKSQNFRIQKKNPALILASKHKNHVLAAPPDYNIGGAFNYYFSHMMNCIYDCRYCFLQGMYSSANYVVFVNYEDFFDAIRAQSDQHPNESWYFSGYDCDSLALEPVTQFTEDCLSFFNETPNANLELRTKSTQIRGLLKRDPLANCVVAYSFTPEDIASAIEHKAPSIEKRIQALVQLQQAGWKIGLRFDPLIRADNFKQLYAELFASVFERLDTDAIHSVSLGPFRLPKPFYKKVIALYPDEPLLTDKLGARGNMVSYAEDEETEMIEWCSEEILRHVSREQFFPCV